MARTCLTPQNAYVVEEMKQTNQMIGLWRQQGGPPQLS